MCFAGFFDRSFGFACKPRAIMLSSIYSRRGGNTLINTEENTMKYVCTVCGWVYDEEEAGVKWEDLPEDFVCELCGVGKDMFEAE